MDRKRDKTSNKNVIHIKRVLKEKMRKCFVLGKSIDYVKLNNEFYRIG